MRTLKYDVGFNVLAKTPGPSPPSLLRWLSEVWIQQYLLISEEEMPEFPWHEIQEAFRGLKDMGMFEGPTI